MAREDDDWADDNVEDWDEDSDEETYPCPYCGADVYEDAERCPICERYLSDENAPPQSRPWWIVIGVIVAMGLVCLWSLGVFPW